MFKCAKGHVSAPYEAEKKVPVKLRPVETTILSNHRFNKRTGEVTFRTQTIARTEIVSEASFCPDHVDGAPAPQTVDEQARTEKVILDPGEAAKAEASRSAWLERQDKSKRRRDDGPPNGEPTDEEWKALEDTLFEN